MEELTKNKLQLVLSILDSDLSGNDDFRTDGLDNFEQLKPLIDTNIEHVQYSVNTSNLHQSTDTGSLHFQLKQTPADDIFNFLTILKQITRVGKKNEFDIAFKNDNIEHARITLHRCVCTDHTGGPGEDQYGNAVIYHNLHYTFDGYTLQKVEAE